MSADQRRMLLLIDENVPNSIVEYFRARCSGLKNGWSFRTPSLRFSVGKEQVTLP